jgi:hypothetical protein
MEESLVQRKDQPDAASIATLGASLADESLARAQSYDIARAALAIAAILVDSLKDSATEEHRRSLLNAHAPDRLST